MNTIPEGTNLNDKKQFVKAINKLNQEEVNQFVQQQENKKKMAGQMDQLSNMMAMMTKQFEGKSPEEMMKEYEKLKNKIDQEKKEGK